MINWSSIDPNSTPGRIVRLPSRLLPRSAVMSIRRGAARDMKWIAGAAIHGCWLGTYELDKQRLVQRLVRPGMTVYDIGAQAGFYTLIFSRLVGPRGRVIAFEPSLREAHYLVEHVRLNRLDNVRIVQAAVGAAPGLCGFTTDRPVTQNQLTTSDETLMVPIVALDSLGLPEPDLIKMDIEGGESDALRGAVQTLREQQPIVLIALHGPEHASFCPAMLAECGYEVFDLDDKPVVPCQVDEVYALPRGISENRA